MRTVLPQQLRQWRQSRSRQNQPMTMICCQKAKPLNRMAMSHVVVVVVAAAIAAVVIAKAMKLLIQPLMQLTRRRKPAQALTQQRRPCLQSQ